MSAASTAHAEKKLGLDLEASFPNESIPEANAGLGGALRLGNEWDLVVLELTPELVGSYRSFRGTSDAGAYRVLTGVRAGFDLGLKPSAFAHLGVGHFAYSAQEMDVSHTSLAYDVGLALDLTIIPVIDVGAHAALAGIAGSSTVEPFGWAALGGHVEFNFD